MAASALAPLPATRAPSRAWQALAWLLFVATAAALLATITLWAANDFAIPPVTFYRSTWVVAGEWLVIIVPGTVGLLLGLRLPGHRVALTLSLIGLVVALQSVADVLVATPSFASGPFGPAVAWATSTFTFATTALLTIVFVLIFPDGRLASPSWGAAVWLAGIGSGLLVLYQGFAPGYLTWYTEFPNPLAMTGGSETWLRSGWYLGIVLIGVSMVLAGFSLVVRYRRSDLVGRQQLKWFVYGMTVLLVTALLEMAAFALLPRDSALGELSLGALFVGASLPPLAAALAIMRYGLYEIDVLINRTFVFGALTAVLAGLYAAGIRLFQSIFVAVTGQESDGALVLTTLVLATTFTPIKSRLESVAAHRYALPGAGASATARSVVGPSPASQPEPAADALPNAGAVPDADALRALIADVVREELDRRDAHAGPPGEGT